MSGKLCDKVASYIPWPSTPDHRDRSGNGGDHGKRLKQFQVGDCVTSNRRDASATVPLITIGLIVHFNDVLACARDNPPGIEVHTRDRVVVCKGIVDGAGAEIPYLRTC